MVKVRKDKERCLLVEQWIFQHTLVAAVTKEIYSWGGNESDAGFIEAVIETMAKYGAHKPERQVVHGLLMIQPFAEPVSCEETT
jgi:hypothetical protein